MKARALIYARQAPSLGINIWYIDVSEPLGAAGALALLPQNLQTDLMVVTNGDIEKQVQEYSVNAGTYVVSSTLAHLIPENTYYDMADLLNLGLSNRLNLIVYPMHESWIGTGRSADYKQASSVLHSIH